MKQEKRHDKVELIQNALMKGKNREEAAKEFGYKSWKSLDIYMRRQGLKWDARSNTYYNPAESLSPAAPVSTGLTAKVISLFDKGECDPIQAAKAAGFKSHHDMASYMAARGYIWSYEENNYIKSEKKENIISRKTGLENPDDTSTLNETTLSKYIPLLEALLKNEEKLYKFLGTDSSFGTITRYVIPGINKTKSFYMSHELSLLLIEFCQRFNLNQKEVLETALIEFFKTHSFEDEVKELLSK
jgi:hypothetical protein